MGSLLVFDPEKINISASEADKLKSASEDAVVGIVTERGEWCCKLTCLQSYQPCAAVHVVVAGSAGA